MGIEYKIEFKDISVHLDENNTEPVTVEKIPLTNESFYEFCGEKRIEYGTNQFSKNPIIILGCSYAYGHGLNKKDTFPYLLSEFTERPIINFSSCGGDILRSYDDLLGYINYSEENRQLIKNADYVIYIYMYDHISRYLNIKSFYKYYDKLFETSNIEKLLIKNSILRYFLASMKLRQILKNDTAQNEIDAILKKIITRTEIKLKEYSPNAKQIIIIYDEKIPDWHGTSYVQFYIDKMDNKIWSEISKENSITIIHTKDVNGFLYDYKYKLEKDIADWHPNKKAWKIFTPKFANKYIK